MASIAHNQDPDPIDREFADAWIPKPGDVLKRFEVLYVNERPDTFNEGETVPIVTGITGEGSTEGDSPIEVGVERAVHAIHASLRHKFADLMIASGDVIAIKFLGWFRKGEPTEGLGPSEIPKGAKAKDGSFRYRVIRYGDETRGVDWSKYRDDADEDVSNVPADTSGLDEEPTSDDDVAPF